ncbi:unnamed protein product [Cyprideis torosa]|uniref:Uncharacterized protein n=1 Tax=Cyprideis torosa TaxID=163714 RepID=A0A7R8W3T9_9CRUS|nr:unnamed protein product [Cyprideis torosa]CAG0878894.1 unnamed protein product [Cyprideis torosa]
MAYLSSFCFLLILSGGGRLTTDAAISLGTYNVDPGSITVSGLSSGGAMSTQFHVAHSQLISGVAIFAAPAPYRCALGSLTLGLTCMSSPLLTNVDRLIQDARDYANAGRIDPIANMQDDKVFLFQGTNDGTVRPGNGPLNEEFYRAFTNPENIKTVFNVEAGHGFPTDIEGNSPCHLTEEPNYINDCDYNAVGDMFEHFYGPAAPESSGGARASGTLYEFDQGEFFLISPPALSSMDSIGLVYVPAACELGDACKLHVAFHGCNQGRQEVGNVFHSLTNFEMEADRHNVIVLYPQVIASLLTPVNPQGCWDWWGYNLGAYATQEGNQIIAVKRMIDKIIGADRYD